MTETALIILATIYLLIGIQCCRMMLRIEQKSGMRTITPYMAVPVWPLMLTVFGYSWLNDEARF